MNIEFYSPSSSVPGAVIRYVKERITCLYGLIKVVSLAEVHFKETEGIENSKTCLISFAISDSLLSVECSAGNYMVAAQKALDAIAKETGLQTALQSKVY